LVSQYIEHKIGIFLVVNYLVLEIFNGVLFAVFGCVDREIIKAFGKSCDKLRGVWRGKEYTVQRKSDGRVWGKLAYLLGKRYKLVCKLRNIIGVKAAADRRS